MNITEMISFIAGILGVSGCGLLFYRQTKKEKELSNDKMAVSLMMDSCEYIKREVDILRAEKIELSAQLKSERDEHRQAQNRERDLMRDVDTLSTKYAISQSKECIIKGCTNRDPQTGY